MQSQIDKNSSYAYVEVIENQSRKLEPIKEINKSMWGEMFI